jgi:LAO/AO transport system kinase
MEVADVFVLNKADLPGADKLEAEIRAMQGLASEHREWIPPVLRTVASTGEGVAALMEAVGRAPGRGVGRPNRITGALRSVQDDVPLGPGLDHLGIAVKSIAAARGFYELLGMAVGNEQTVEHEQVKTAMLPLGASRIELLEPTADDSTIGRFLARRGEGLHHVAIRVEELDERFAAMKAAGMRLASDTVRVGAGGHRYFFVHPESTGGVLVELVGA